MEEEIFHLLGEMIECQKKKLLSCGRAFVPTLTSEDVLQPNDYAELEYNPHFRFEEGILLGMESMRTALSAFFKDKKNL